jgi:hypothetical protein
MQADHGVWSTIARYAACYALWVTLVVWMAWILLLLRGLTVEWMMWMRFNPWSVRGFDRWGVFLLGMAWLVAMLWLESYLRDGVQRGRLLRRAGRVALALGITTAAAYAGQAIIRWSAGAAS